MWQPLEKHVPIALDIGSASIRAVQFQRHPAETAVRHWTHQVVASEGSGNDSSADLAGILSRVEPIGWDLFRGREVVTTIGPPELEICSLHVPPSVLELSHELLLQSIQHEVGHQISHPVDEVEIDCWPVTPGHGNGPNLMVGAVRKEVIHHIIEWINHNGYVCSRIDFAPLSTLRGCAGIMPDLPPDQLWGVLDIGDRASRLYLAVGETPVYVRTMQSGAHEMRKRIVDELGVQPAIAERYKRLYGIRAEDTGYRPMLAKAGAMDESRMASILLGVLNPILHQLADDIEKSFRYGLELYPDLPINCLVLTGGGASLDGLDEVLAKRLGLRVRRLTAESSLRLNGDHPMLVDNVLAGMANCIGLSFGAIQS